MKKSTSIRKIRKRSRHSRDSKFKGTGARSHLPSTAPRPAFKPKSGGSDASPDKRAHHDRKVRDRKIPPSERKSDRKSSLSRAFQVRFRLTEQCHSSLKAEQILLEHLTDVGTSLPTATPIYDTLKELAVFYKKPSAVVGPVPRYASSVYQFLDLHCAAPERELGRNSMKLRDEELDHDTEIGPGDSILYTIFDVNKYQVAKYLRMGMKVSCLYIRPGVHFGGEISVTDRGTSTYREEQMLIRIQNVGSFKMEQPFFIRKPVTTVTQRIFVEGEQPVQTIHITTTSEQLSRNVFIYTFHHTTDKPDVPNFNLNHQNQEAHTPKKLVDAQCALGKAFGVEFRIAGEFLVSQDVIIPFSLINKIKVFSLEKEVDGTYSRNLNAYMGRQIRQESSISEEHRTVLLTYLPAFYQYMLVYRSRMGGQTILNRLFRGGFKRTLIGWARIMENIKWNPLSLIPHLMIGFSLFTIIFIFSGMNVLLAGCVTFAYIWGGLRKAIYFALLSLTAYYLMIVFLAAFVLAEAKDYHEWEGFKHSVEEGRLCIYAQGKIPQDAFLLDFETLVDPHDYPLHSSSKIKVVDPEERLDRKPAVKPVGIVYSSKAPIVHSTSQHNCYVALCSRALLDMPCGEAEAWEELGLLVDPILIEDCGGYPDYVGDTVEFNGTTFEPHGPVTYKEYYDRFPKNKKLKMDRCLDKINSGDVEPKNFCFETFIKREKIMNITKEQFVPIRPRVIQGCSQAIKVTAGPWYLNYSYALKNAWHPRNRIWYCSGYSGDMYNAWFNHWTDEFGGVANCLFVGSDFSKYDVTQGEFCMTREYNWYKRLGIGKIPYGKFSLRVKKHYRGYARGIKYSRDFTRKSGEPDTSAGNSKNTGEAISSYWIKIGMLFVMAVLGDDNFTILNLKEWFDRKEIPFWQQKAEVERLMQELRNFVTRLGYVLKIQFSNVPEKVEFLSSRYYRNSEGFHIGKKPGSVISKLGYFLFKPHLKFEDYLGYLKGAVISLKPVCNHVPFLRVYCAKLLELTEQVNAIKPEDIEHRMYIKGQISELDETTWDGFYEVYGLTEDDEADFALQLSKVKSLPFILNSPYLDDLVRVDDEL